MKDNELIRRMHNRISNPEPKNGSTEKYYEIIFDENNKPQKRELTKEEAKAKENEFNEEFGKIDTEIAEWAKKYKDSFGYASPFLFDFIQDRVNKRSKKEINNGKCPYIYCNENNGCAPCKHDYIDEEGNHHCNKPLGISNDVNASKTTDHNPNTVKETRTVEPQPSVTYVTKSASAMDINEIISALKTPSVREEIKSIIREVESEEPILADNAEQHLKKIVKDALEEAEMEIIKKLFRC